MSARNVSLFNSLGIGVRFTTNDEQVLWGRKYGRGFLFTGKIEQVRWGKVNRLFSLSFSLFHFHNFFTFSDVHHHHPSTS